MLGDYPVMMSLIDRYEMKKECIFRSVSIVFLTRTSRDRESRASRCTGDSTPHYF